MLSRYQVIMVMFAVIYSIILYLWIARNTSGGIFKSSVPRFEPTRQWSTFILGLNYDHDYGGTNQYVINNVPVDDDSTEITGLA